MIEHLLETGDYEVISLGGAVEHESYQPTRTDEYGDLWTIYPIEGYGDPDTIRSTLRSERPDIFWFMTDPRFYGWLWQMEDEIRTHCPMVYYHVWDNYPVPDFNKDFYDSTDKIVTISELTEDIVSQVTDKAEHEYLPHTVDTKIFRNIPDNRVNSFVNSSFDDSLKDKFLFMYNGRNARRKQTGSLMFWFKEFLDKVGHDKASLVMHTDPNDENGQDLKEIANKLNFDDNEVVFSTDKVSQDTLALLYNSVDCYVQISDAEGFGVPLCLKPDTDIDTSDGLKTIGDIQIGDQVLSDDGDFHKVVDKSVRTVNDSLKISSLGNLDIVASCEHPFRVVERGRTDFQRFKERAQNKKVELEWKEASDLQEHNHYLTHVRPDLDKDLPDKIDLVEWIDDGDNIQYDDEYIWEDMGYSPNVNGLSISDIQEKYDVSAWYAASAKRLIQEGYFRGDREPTQKMLDLRDKIIKDDVNLNSKQNKVKRFIDVDDKFLEVMGWYLAEGSNIGGVGVELDFHEDEIDVAEWINDVFEEKFDVTNGVVECEGWREDSKASRFYCSSSILSEFFGKLCGIHAGNKRIHPEFYQAGGKLAPLVKGYFKGDGCKSVEGMASFHSISKKLLSQIRQILLSKGIFSCFQENDREDRSNCNIEYNLNIGGMSHKKFCNWLDVEYVNEQDRKRHENVVVTDRYIFTPVQQIEEAGQNEVVNITVEDTHTFVAEGVVTHNCEAKACELPVIGTMTGGIQDQLTNGEEWFGIGLEPSSKAIIGSQNVPYIYEDRLAKDDVVDAMLEMYNMSEQERDEMGKKGRQDVLQRFNFQDYCERWDEIFKEMHSKHDSWPNKQYDRWVIEEVA